MQKSLRLNFFEAKRLDLDSIEFPEGCVVP